MKIKISQIAELIGGKIVGDESQEISGIAKIEEAVQGDLTFLYHPSYLKYLAETNASVVLIKPDMEKTNPGVTYIEVAAPNVALQKILVEFFNPVFELTGIDQTAFIHPSAKIGKNVSIGKNVIIDEKCIIGDNTKIYHNTVLYKNVSIGRDCLIHANITLRNDTVIGDRVVIHSGTVIGADGFGFTPDQNGVYQKVPQIGNVVIEDDVELGANVTIDRAAMGSTIVKEGTKIDNLVQVAHNVTIGKHTVISAQSGISGSTKVGNHCMLGGQAGLTGHIELGDKILVGAQTGVSKSLLKPGTYFGSPAEEIGMTLKIEAHKRNLPDYAARIKKLEKELELIKEKIKGNE